MFRFYVYEKKKLRRKRVVFRNLFITKHDPRPGKSGSYTTVKEKDINERIPLDAFSNGFILVKVWRSSFSPDIVLAKEVE